MVSKKSKFDRHIIDVEVLPDISIDENFIDAAARLICRAYNIVKE